MLTRAQLTQKLTEKLEERGVEEADEIADEVVECLDEDGAFEVAVDDV